MMVSANIQFVDADDGTGLAYCATPTQAPENKGRPGIVFLSGFMSDMTGKKATVLEAWAKETGHAFLRLDYAGHGASGGAFRDGTIGRWRDDALTAIRHAGRTVPGLGDNLVIVGSSMGGWIAALVAKTLSVEADGPTVSGLVTIAAAADFTEDLLPARLGAQALAEIAATGAFEAPSDYADEPCVITRELLEEGRDHLLLDRPLNLNIPIRLIHGSADPDVPWTQSQKLMEVLTSDDVEFVLIKDGDHRLSEPRDLARMVEIVERLCDQVAARSAANPVR